ncbi:hypothetical protein [Mycobacteroides abscessus]|uniref:hypothetical protein n=1 Tax=Mycobacteroides abscessus TaxID=36809 RepID=UPI000927B6B1|nr:hypothetical protein [Mycobacteroides abscessus]SIC58860.1 Uncharacterised protein [Mycobacteroides abscessus subsp. abscessus]
MNLNDKMQFDHIVRVLPDGTVIDSPRNDHFDSVEEILTPDGSSQDRIEGIPEGWELLRGFSGQYNYHGPTFHQSEFVGGGLERHILETPGDYVCLVASGYREDGSQPEFEDDDRGYGWWIAYRPLDKD